MSQRRACRVVGQHRSTQRVEQAAVDGDRELRARLCVFARGHPRWGYRRAHAVLVREGHHVNRKKIQRLWREEGLRVPTKRRKHLRLGVSTMPADRPSPKRSRYPTWAARGMAIDRRAPHAERPSIAPAWSTRPESGRASMQAPT